VVVAMPISDWGGGDSFVSTGRLLAVALL